MKLQFHTRVHFAKNAFAIDRKIKDRVVQKKYF